MFYMIELIDIWSICLKDAKINLFLDLWVLMFVWLNWCHSRCQMNSQYFYLQEKKKSIYKDTLNTFDLTSKMHILRIYIVVEWHIEML